MQGSRGQDYTLTQLRRFRDDNGGVVAVRETLQVDADGTANPPFALTFVGVDGELSGSPIFQKWQQTYQKHGRQFYEQGFFRVRDLAKAQSNYTLHQFGAVVRAGRSAFRVVVFPQPVSQQSPLPQSADKAIWVLDVDAQTSVPLYAAEFDMQLRLLAEVEAEVFSPTVQLAAGSAVQAGVVSFTDFAAAAASLGHPSGLIDPNVGIANEYELNRVQVRDNPLNGQHELKMTYTDGLDQFVVVQRPGTPDLFAGMPSQANGVGNTICRYRDEAMSLLLFWDDGVSFQVAGRGSFLRLDGVARSIYLQALSTN